MEAGSPGCQLHFQLVIRFSEVFPPRLKILFVLSPGFCCSAKSFCPSPGNRPLSLGYGLNLPGILVRFGSLGTRSAVLPEKPSFSQPCCMGLLVKARPDLLGPKGWGGPDTRGELELRSMSIVVPTSNFLRVCGREVQAHKLIFPFTLICQAR